MKLSRSERKAINQSRREGYNEGYLDGYKKGLYDGNPFNAWIEAFTRLAKTLSESPELKELMKQRKDLESIIDDIESEDE